MKAHDLFAVPACRSCHIALDQGGELTRDARRDAWEYAFSQYIVQLWVDGRIWRIG